MIKTKNNMTLSFVKEKTPWYLIPVIGKNAWYIDLPEYMDKGIGTKLNLRMVRGADDLLELLGQGKEKVSLHVDTKPFKNNLLKMKMYKHDASGGTYRTDLVEVPDVWLCNVTKYLFGGQHPWTIYVNADARV